jgi:hypothetical protein
MKEKKILNYIGLAQLIYNNKQPKYVNLILNTSDYYKVKYIWDEYNQCYIIEDKFYESENYSYYLRDSLLDCQNFERCIEIIEEPKEEKKIEKIRQFCEYSCSDKYECWSIKEDILVNKINEIIDKLNKLKKENE